MSEGLSARPRPSRRSATFGRGTPLRLGAIVALSPIFFAGAAAAQDLPTAPPTQVSDSVQAMMTEYQQTQQRLGELQVQAINADSRLEAHRSSIDTMVIDAMAEVNPDTPGHIERLDELSEQALEAQQARDMETLQTLVNEATTLRQELDAAQSEALKREDIQAEIQSFEEELATAVLEIDPEADQLMDRLDELAEALSAAGPGDI